MLLKILTIFVIIAVFHSTINASIFRDYTEVGDAYEFNFGGKIKGLMVIREEGNEDEELMTEVEGKFPNIRLTEEGILIISPVTENDFGIYHVIVENENKTEEEEGENDEEVTGEVTAPPTLYLSRKTL
ncbi:Immunoglobulin-like fold domain-containing protein [Strongyloides ratti]|uniref:Immunoglobulin-like fold domain-containing protein n=1 Tax=Strongyloides ratti TaxID=34506 RepID=A0A090L357_STRRB|nr:Immunoglobulin-like fold domain-containing protein [Strongyloides ratti]CEF62557.1 Immunoglobulin-like fold domain-containing protein [Strongyloides ratti]